MLRKFVVVGIVGMAAVGALGARQTQSVWDGIYTDEQADRGEPLYQSTCASCHSTDLSGGEMAPGLVGGDFVWGWSGLTLGQMFEQMRVSMPQDDPSSVSRQEKADILAFILRANDFPVGDRELASRTEALDQFMFEAARP